MPKHENASATSVIREFGCTYPRNGAFTFARYEKNIECPGAIRDAMRQSFTTNVVPTPGRDVHVTLPP